MLAPSFLTGEKRTIVIQLGRSLTKIGYEGEPKPRAIIGTSELQGLHATCVGTSSLTREEWENILEGIVNRIFYQHLHVIPSIRRVVIVEHDFTATSLRYALAEILFARMKIQSLVYLSEMVAPLYLTEVSTGLVIDVGFSETRILPVCFGMPIYEAYQAVPIGSRTINQQLKNLLVNTATSPDLQVKVELLPTSTIEEIKVKCCYVRFEIPSCNTKGENGPASFLLESKNDLSFVLDAETNLLISAENRWKAAEVLFTQSETHLTIVEAFFKSLEACNAEVKKYVVENIVFCGGGAQLRGFTHRFLSEVKQCIIEKPYAESLWPRFRMSNPKRSPLLRQWNGGAIFSALCDTAAFVPYEIHLTDWETGSFLPDWLTPPELRVIEAQSTEGGPVPVFYYCPKNHNRIGISATVVGENGGHEDRGEVARLQYFVGAIAVGDLVKSTLGPRGTDKILQPIGGEGCRTDKTRITNDGATILQAVWLDNPAAKILVDLSKQQDVQCGDGTTGVVVLAAELLRNAERLVEQKIHPQVICAGYRLALQAARKALLEMTQTHDSTREDLMNVARTTLSSKLLTHEKEQFAQLAVDAVLRLQGKASLDYIKIIKKSGGTIRDSFLEPGFILEKSIGIDQPHKLTNCNILVANTPMDTDKIKIYGARVKVDSFKAVQELEEAEREKMKAKVEKIAKHGCNVFINRQLIYNYPDQLFRDHGIMAIEHADFDGTERLAAVLGAEIASTFDDPSKTRLGFCESIDEIMIGDDRAIRFSGCRQNEACTIVLRGANLHILDEAERSLHDALATLSQMVQDRRVVFGAGAAEMWMAEAVDNLARNVEGKKSLAIEAFASALRQIPTIIAGNAGFDAAELVAKLRVAHHVGNMTAGIDISTGLPGNAESLGILESYFSKLSQLCAAAEAAEMIIRVDDIIRCAPRQREGM